MKFTSNVIASGSGSMGGTTISRNRYGMYMRSRVTPVNPSTGGQAAVRSVFAQCVNAWTTTLTDAQRAGWDLYAANVPVLGPLGLQQFLTGQNHFIRANTSRIQGGLSLIEAAPAVFDLGSLTAPSVVPDVSLAQIVVSYNNADEWANGDGGALLVYQGQPVNPSRNFYKGPWRFAGVVLGDGATPPTSPANLATEFPLTVGQLVYCYARAIQADGRLSAPVYFSGAVIA